MISITNIHKRFGETPILCGVDLQVQQGTVTVILGASGSGKTTFLRCINALEMPERGQIRFDDGSLTLDFEKKPNKKQILALRRKTAMVFQHYNLFPHKTALENLTEGMVQVQKIPLHQALEQSRVILERVGLADRMQHYPHQLSGGQQQRVGIARALALRPELMLFDEPTSALDPELVQGMLDLMQTLAQEGRTMIIVTHEINFARNVADRVIIMDGGEIVEEGAAKTVFESPQHPRTQSFLKALGR